MTCLLVSLAQILAEPFDDPAALDRGQVVDGARTGDGPASTAALDAGALRLEGTAATRRWIAWTRTAPLGGARWVRVCARMRTEGVSPAGARYANCNLYIRFDDGTIEATRALFGTNDWTPVARRLPVPARATQVTVGCFLSMPGRAWFDDLRVEAVDPPDWRTAQTEHYVYHWLPGDDIPADARRFNEESYRIAAEFLGVSEPMRATYFKYPDRAAKDEYTADPGNAHRRGRQIHSIWPTDRHEIVHVLAEGWGEPPALLGEGLAVYLSGGWQGRPVAEAAREALDRGQWIALGEILDTRRFRHQPDLVTYAIAGALVEWIVGTHGRDALGALYGRLRHAASETDNRRVFEEVLGVPLEDADAALRESLGRR